MISLFISIIFNEIPDGSLLFIKGGNAVVREVTNSDLSHVAIIFNINGKPWVYEAVRPVCRKVSLEKYIEETKILNVERKRSMVLLLSKPKYPINIKKMKEYAEEQLGRKYSINSYVSGKQQKSIHCGEMTARCMIAGGIPIDGNCCKKNPQDILDISRSYYQDNIRLFP